MEQARRSRGTINAPGGTIKYRYYVPPLNVG